MSARHVTTTNKTTSNDYFIGLIALLVCVGAAISVALVILNLANMGFSLTTMPFLLIVIVDVALVALPFYLVLSGKVVYSNFVRFGCFALAALMLFINLFVSSNLTVTSDFLNEQYGGSSGAIEYSVVAQRSADIALPTTSTIRAGIQSTDTNKSDVEVETKKLASASFTEYSNLSDMIGATEDKDLDVAVVQSAMLDAYKEYFPDSFNNLDIVATFKAGTTTAGTGMTNATVDITKPFSIYISGADVNGDIDQVARSDSNIIVFIDPVRYKILLVNTPRDYYVQLHGTSGYRDKLTHSGIYGIDMSVQTLQDLYGINIDYHVRVNFDTLPKLVDSMGGINVDNPTAFSIWGNNYAAGNIYLTGDYALMYCRARHDLAGGDNDRGENQQRVIEAIVDRITKPNVIVHYKDIIQAMSGSFRSNIPPSVITQLVSRQMSLGGHWTIEKTAVTGTNSQQPTYSMGSQLLSVVIPDQSSVDAVSAQIHDFLNGQG